MNQLTEYRNPILIGIGGLLVALILWFAWVSPTGTHLNNLNASEASLNSQVSQLNSKLASLKSERQKIPQICQNLKKITTQIPSVQSPADVAAIQSQFFSDMTSLATKSQVIIPTLSNGSMSGSTSSTAPSSATTTSGGATALPIGVTATGSFGAINAFIAGLDVYTNFPRLFTISGFGVSLGAAGAGSTQSVAPPAGGSVSAGPPLWVGGSLPPPTAGPYTVIITGDIYYTTVSTGTELNTCAQAEKVS